LRQHREILCDTLIWNPLQPIKYCGTSHDFKFGMAPVRYNKKWPRKSNKTIENLKSSMLRIVATGTTRAVGLEALTFLSL